MLASVRFLKLRNPIVPFRTFCTQAPKTTRVYVGNLPWDTTPEALSEHFKGVGQIANIVLLRKQGGRFMGSCFVEFSTLDQVQKAIEGFNGTMFGGRSISVKEEIPRAPRPEGRVENPGVFVTNLPIPTIWSDLKEVFSKCGKVVRVVLLSKEGAQTGRAIVTFEKIEEAKEALSLSSTDFKGNQISVYPSKPRPPRSNRDDARGNAKDEDLD